MQLVGLMDKYHSDTYDSILLLFCGSVAVLAEQAQQRSTPARRR